jgi:hypothetical protein
MLANDLTHIDAIDLGVECASMHLLCVVCVCTYIHNGKLGKVRRLFLCPTASKPALGSYYNFRWLPKAIGNNAYIRRLTYKPSEITVTSDG